MRTMILLVVAATLSACSSEPTKPVVVSAAPAPVAAAAPASSAVSIQAASAETEAQRLGRGIKMLAGKSVYFNYDDYTVKADYQDLIKQHIELMRVSPSYSLRLEGNADERGSVEYNLALGQKRAESVKRSLKLLGLPEARVEAVSYGKEKPRALCHEEKCWADNRRVDFEYKKSSANK